MKKINLQHLHQCKQTQEPIACITAYDASFTRLVDQADIDVILVGDSLGNVIQGHSSTVPVTIEDMRYHTACVAQANPRSLIIGDLPFMTYAHPNQAADNATILMQAGANMVKLEGGQWLVATVKHLTERGIAVCGHLGLTPQSISTLGAYGVQGKSEQDAKQLLEDALALENAGASMLVLECIPTALAKHITSQLSIPTIGIGSGPDCDGQILVLYDLLGMKPGKPFKFVQTFLNQDNPSIEAALRAYCQAVKNKTFPSEQHILA